MPQLLQRSEGLSAFLGGWMISLWSWLTLDSVLKAALTGFVGAVASYAGTATTGWTYGIYDLRLRAGHIENHRFISMHELEELYG